MSHDCRLHPYRLHPYRLGFAVKILGGGGLATSDTRRWGSGPHLSRSLELLDAAFDYLERIDARVYRIASSTIPYGTHPDLPELDYRRQIGECEEGLAALGEKATRLGLRLSTHPGQYTVLNAEDAELVRKSSLDLEQDALLLDALGQGAEAAVVVHVGGVYGDRAAALDRWARAYEALSERARGRIAVEHDETSFDVTDVLALHGRTGVRVVTTTTTIAAIPESSMCQRPWRRRPRPGATCGRRCTCRARAPSSVQSAAEGPRGCCRRSSTSTPTSSPRGTWPSSSAWRRVRST